MTRTGQLSPTTARRIEVSTTFGPIAGLRSGTDGAPDVLLLPGFTGSKEDFTPLLDPVADAGFRATAIDLPGQYESPGCDDPTCYSPDRLGATVHAVAQQLSGPVHLVGHSFGGLVARAAVIADSAPFADLVLMSSGPAAITGLRRQRLDDLEPLLPAGLAAVYDVMHTAIEAEADYLAPPPELADFLRRRFLSGSPAMLAGMGTALRTEPDRVEELATKLIDILVLWGTADDAWPPEAQARMAERLSARAVAVEDAAHSPAVENTAATAAALVQFWRR
ncbi:MAG TPA: alpha/beta hydrolase [Jatrophihabitantaceae bacterium]|nr:alpha/beta hydrolase [Jatrophihabitantaceae bacterium]